MYNVLLIITARHILRLFPILGLEKIAFYTNKMFYNLGKQSRNIKIKVETYQLHPVLIW